MTQKYKLKNAVLMMALAAVYPMQSFAAAGVAQFTAGDVSLRRGAGSDPLLKGKDIESGDAIVTGPNGRAQVRFSDGGLVALQPNSQFNISNYADKNDGKQDSFFVDLLRGGMRAVTGLIGKRNHDNYKVTTTTATIGIRGSAFNLAYNPDGSLSVSTELDEIEVCTRAGCVGLKAGESALVVSAQEAPIRTSTRASLPTPEPRQDPIVVSNQIAATPLPPTAPPPPAAPPPPTAPPRVLAGLAFAGSGLITPPPVVQMQPAVSVVMIDGGYVFDPARYDQRTYLEGTLYLDANGNPEIYLAATGGAAGQRTGTATVVSKTGTMAGGDYLLLGSWTANTWTEGGNTKTIAPSAFVVGLPTLPAGLASLVGQSATYAYAAGTPVFSSSGDPGELLATSKLKVDFLAAGNFVDVSLDVRMPTRQQVITALNGSSDFNLRGGATGTGAGFSGNLSVSSADCVNNGSSCGTGVFNGFFGGNHAEKAGVSFVADTGYNGYITGAATFTQGALTAIPTTVSSGFQAAFLDGSNHYYAYSYIGNSYYTYLGANYSGYDEFTFNGNQLVKYKGYDYSSNVTVERTTAPGTFGSIGNVADTDFIGWGNWVTAQETSAYGSYSSGSSMMDQLHYIVGKPTANMPNAGSGNYALVGGTAPTATYNGVSQLGQLVNGNLTVDFYSGLVGVNINTKFGTTNVNTSSNASISGSTFRSCNGNSQVNGIFTGTLAYRAGLVYSTYVGGTLGNVTGAAAFQRTSGNPAYYNNNN